MAARFGDALTEAIEVAERWAIHDPDPVTRGQIDALVDAGDPKLIRLFGGRLAFGTAGLRAAVGPGPNRMNALVVRQTTVGVVRWLCDQGTESPSIVIGYDGRPDSRRFAEHVAVAVSASGGVALLADDVVATPIAARAVLDVGADAAVVITASHNPPTDNGYKLYLGDGLQIVAPADAEIAAAIEVAASEWSTFGSAIDDVFAERDLASLMSAREWTRRHRDRAIDALLTNDRGLQVAYTAMHGVGGTAVVQAFDAAGFPSPHVVAEQFEADGTFPTVSFPNPEEPGALDLVVALAIETGSEAAFANDPDADRLAIAVPDRSGTFTSLSGNELGVLLGDHVLRNTSGVNRLVARSVVSSRQLDAMARAAGVEPIVALTGFKWVARPIVSHPDHQFIFGYEEAIGYCVGDQVRDKDGITAAVVAAEMMAALKASGQTVWDRLDQLAAAHGVFANRPSSVRFDDNPARVAELMQQIVERPPADLGGSPVVASGPVGLGQLPPTSGLHLVAEDKTQVIIRPSGTEPKIKAYIEVVELVAGSTLDQVGSARTVAEARLALVAAEIDQMLNRR